MSDKSKKMRGEIVSEAEASKGLGFSSVEEFRAWCEAGSPIGECSNERCCRPAFFPHLEERCKHCGAAIAVTYGSRTDRELRIGIDIGGVISRYPVQMLKMIHLLVRGGATVYIVTDMNQEDALAACKENGITKYIRRFRILSADWFRDGDLCKSKLIKKNGIDIMIDDRPDYVAQGEFIGLVLSPRPQVPYYHPTWINKSTPSVCVPSEEYEEFAQWRSLKDKNND